MKLTQWIMQNAILPIFVKYVLVRKMKKAIAKGGGENKCVWLLGTPCNNPPVYWAEMFNVGNGPQIRIPICEQHLHEHRVIMSLWFNKYGGMVNATEEECDEVIGKILNATYEEREKMMEGVELLPWDKI